VEPIDEILRTTVRAAGRYDVPERMIAAAATALESMGDDARRQAGVNALHDAVLQVARLHGGPHDGCGTCSAVRNGLAVAMGVVRAEVDVDFEGRL
jgi:hypothetical protein